MPEFMSDWRFWVLAMLCLGWAMAILGGKFLKDVDQEMHNISKR